MKTGHLIASLFPLFLFLAVAQGQPDPAVPPIAALDGIQPDASVFNGSRWNRPLAVRSTADAARHFSGDALAALNKQVDFDDQIVLVFAWRGSGQDRLEYAVQESFPEQIAFRFAPGRTRDLRSHVKVYALRSNVTWRIN